MTVLIDRSGTVRTVPARLTAPKANSSTCNQLRALLNE